MRKILKGEAKANARHRRRYVERVRALSKNVKSYEELLKTEIDGARSGLELAGAAMQLMDLPEEDGDSGAAQPDESPSKYGTRAPVPWQAHARRPGLLLTFPLLHGVRGCFSLCR